LPVYISDIDTDSGADITNSKRGNLADAAPRYYWSIICTLNLLMGFGIWLGMGHMFGLVMGYLSPYYG
jgi:hypothetical protein